MRFKEWLVREERADRVDQKEKAAAANLKPVANTANDKISLYGATCKKR